MREERVLNVLTSCGDYWRRNGVPDAKVAEMSGELGDHLQEALKDGKSVEDVVGEDVGRFAEDWAAPSRPTRSLWEETLNVVSDSLAGLAVAGVLVHVALWSPTLPVSTIGALGGLLSMLLFVRLFAYLRAPSDASPDSEESVGDRYPWRIAGASAICVSAVWAAHSYLPLPEGVLFRWPIAATLALPLVAVLVLGTKRFVSAGSPADTGQMPGKSGRHEDETQRRSDVMVECSIHWRKMGIPEEQANDLLHDLNEYIRQAEGEGQSVRSVVGDDVEEFAEAWAEEHGVELRPGSSPEPELLRDVISGWVLSVSAGVTIIATLFHLVSWSLYVPPVLILGIYLLVVAAWFGEPVANFLRRADSWRYSPWKSMLAAGGVVLLIAGVSIVMALFFMGVGPQIPFQWPWYATVTSALVAGSIAAVWLRGYYREDEERKRKTMQE